MPDETSNAPASFGVEKARREYDRKRKARRKARRRWVKLKHQARKAKHKLERRIDRRKASKHKHDGNAIRDAIVDYAFWGTHNEPSIHYSQGSSRFAALDKPRTLPLYTDCSAFATLACKDAGAEDPNGLGYNGSGFTGTLYNHCPKVSVGQTQPGDLLEHGGYPGSHVNVVVESGSNPMVVSHGQESGPRLYPASVEIAAHAGQSANYLRTV